MTVDKCHLMACQPWLPQLPSLYSLGPLPTDGTTHNGPGCSRSSQQQSISFKDMPTCKYDEGNLSFEIPSFLACLGLCEVDKKRAKEYVWYRAERIK